ncbi:MAG: rubredoxin-like domain-containing protein [Bacillota bacterium]
MNKWRCQECGYALEAEVPPEVCPSCANKCTFVDNNCYIPDCGKCGNTE